MAARSGVEWTDSTVNFWWGCTKVGPGCDRCYAEKWDKRTGGAHWGLGVPRRKIAGSVKLMYRLDAQAPAWSADYEVSAGNARAFNLPAPAFGPRRRVFCQSMSDLFDTEVPIAWFAEAWDTIASCDGLALQIVTKRLPVVEKRIAAIDRSKWPQHAGLIISVVNQAEADRDLPRLREIRRRLGIPWVGLSIEPMIGAIRLSPADLAGIDWVICGGESGKDARLMPEQWAADLLGDCSAAGVAFFMKQMTGKKPPPPHLLVREFPEALR
jgi:protein gp37